MGFAATVPGIVSLALYGLEVCIILDIIISYCIQFGVKMSAYGPFVRTIRSIVNPILNPIRKILPPPGKTGGWDLSPMLAILLLNVLQNIVVGYGH